ncbi:MAG: hypothetical protein HC880_17785, partial [Bacteroidia bacterium]|nr:hypothetical protein [Bacteroidia bacterium]
GFYYAIRDNLIIAKAAVSSDPVYINELTLALNGFLNNWEASNFATVIYYANDAKNKIINANNTSDPAEKNNLLGSALHSYAEAVAFSYGWLGLDAKLITDSEIEDILELLLVKPGQAPESYRFAQEPALLDNFDQIIDLIQGVYGFSETQVNGFFVNN